MGIILLLFISVVYYGVYLIYHTWKFINYKPVTHHYLFHVSVIVPIRNESDYIISCLKSILAQDYPKDLLEIIIVNDHSEDNSLVLLRAYADYPNIKILNLPIGKQGKKEAISYGIEHAGGELIITTDGDTIRNEHWVRTMVSYFGENTALVSGPVRLSGISVWQEMQALEFAGLVLLGGAMIANKRPSLCNGANLAYRKKVFLEVNGFQNISHIASGDDELLLHKIRHLKKYAIVFAKNTQAIVETPAQFKLKSFIYQRIRWTSKSTVYPDKWITFHLMMAYFANLSIIISLFYGLLYKEKGWIFFILLFMKVLAEGITLYFATKFLNQKKLLKWFLLEQFLHIIYVLWVGVVSQIKKTYVWKGRKVR